MGVDYTANYGIGYKVIESDEIPEEELEDGLSEYLYKELGEDFECFEVGSECYTGETNDVYIVLTKAFNSGLDLAKNKAKLDEELDRLKLLPDSEFGDVGGLLVW
jgi:hypothetical protein